MRRFWAELEVNYSRFQEGENDGKTQVFLSAREIPFMDAAGSNHRRRVSNGRKSLQRIEPQRHFFGSFSLPNLRRPFFSGVTLLATLVCAVLFDGALASSGSPTDITVSAAISLRDSLDEIVRLYRPEHPNVTVYLNLGASGTLQRQIEQGAPVDVFISASPSEMDSLQSKRLILSDTRSDLVKNSVVLIVPKGASAPADFRDLTNTRIKVIAIGDPQSVPAGSYAKQVLTHFGLYEGLRPKFVFAKDVRQVLTYVETGNADAGIVYATDARTSTRVSIVATAPKDSHAPVIYPVAVLAGSRNVEAAKSFVAFLLSSKCAQVFDKHGFVPEHP
jgi:molybdate transport system substrate-binding protein